MSQEIEYPFNGVGIPFSEMLPQSLSGQIEGFKETASGREIYYRISSREIYIVDRKLPDNDYHLFAKVDYLGSVSFGIRTRPAKEDPKKPFDVHPDFFASEFIKMALNHFQNSTEVISCRGKWHPGSMNLTEFMEHFDKTGDKVESALNTWSGRNYTQNGFGQLSEREVLVRINSNHPFVEAIFRRGES